MPIVARRRHALLLCLAAILAGLSRGRLHADPLPKDGADFQVEYRVREFERVLNFATGTGGVLQMLTSSRYDTFLYTESTHLNLTDDVTLDLQIPYLSAHIAGFVEGGGAISRVDSTVSGLQPITLAPRFYIRDPDADGGGYYVDLRFTTALRDGADRIDQQVLNFLREGGLRPWMTLFSGGFDILLDNVWTWHQGTRRTLELHASVLLTGEYAPVTDIPAHYHPADTGRLHATYTYKPRKKQTYRWNLDLAGYTTGSVDNPRADTLVATPTSATFIPGRSRGMVHDLDTVLQFEFDQTMSRRDATQLSASFGLPGSYDLLASDASIVRSVQPNATYGATAAWFHRPSRRELWGYRLEYEHVGRVRAAGQDVPDAQRDALAATLRWDRKLLGGYSLFIQNSVGLTVDAPLIVGLAGFHLVF